MDLNNFLGEMHDMTFVTVNNYGKIFGRRQSLVFHSLAEKDSA